MERTEKIGLGIATAGHVLLFGLLSAGFLATPNPLKLNSPPMDVSLVDEVALQSTAPRISTQPPPPSEALDQGPTEDAAPAPAPTPPPEPAPAPEPEPAPAPPPPKPAPPRKPVEKAKPKPPAPPKAAEKAKPKPPAPQKAAGKPKPRPEKAKPTPAKAKPATTPAKAKSKANAPAKASGAGKAEKPRGSLLGKDFLKGIESETPAARSDAPPAAAMGPAQKSALDAELRRQLKPHWRPPSGADADKLVTLLEVRLDKSGRVIGTPEVIDQQGVTASNRPQAQIHAERAIQAVKLASPFRNMPPQYYEQWKWLRPLRFDARLNR
ncbi:MAG: cell envelope biogenesis protein TolA [Sphingobium sp.]|nr:cell envelope biogenesis protein TolA [Sphingobium sp.]